MQTFTCTKCQTRLFMTLEQFAGHYTNCTSKPDMSTKNTVPYVNIVSQPCPHELANFHCNSKGLLRLAWIFFKAWLFQKDFTYKLYKGFYALDGESYQIQIGKIPNVEGAITPYYTDWEIERECRARDPGLLAYKQILENKKTADDYERQQKFKKIQQDLEKELYKLKF